MVEKEVIVNSDAGIIKTCYDRCKRGHEISL
jgi:hypothetical protein